MFKNVSVIKSQMYPIKYNLGRHADIDVLIKLLLTVSMSVFVAGRAIRW